jgi:hypothetical protein
MRKQHGHGQQPQHQTKAHPQKTLPNMAKMLLKTKESAAVSSRKKAGAKKGHLQEQNRPKTEGRSRLF